MKNILRKCVLPLKDGDSNAEIQDKQVCNEKENDGIDV